MTDNKRDSDGVVHGLSTTDGSQAADSASGETTGPPTDDAAQGHTTSCGVVQGTQTPRSAVLGAPSAPGVAYRDNDGSSYPDGRQPQTPDPAGVPDPPRADPGAAKPGARKRSNANLQGGTAATAARARAAKKARESGVLSRKELAVILSNQLRSKSLPAHAMASLARVLADIQGYSKGPPPEDAKPQLLDLDALIEELQPDDPDDSTESEAGDPPKPDPEIDKH